MPTRRPPYPTIPASSRSDDPDAVDPRLIRQEEAASEFPELALLLFCVLCVAVFVLIASHL